MESIRGLHSSRLSSFVETISDLMAPTGAYGTRSTHAGRFYKTMLNSAYRDQIESHIADRLAINGATPEDARMLAKRFASGIDIKNVPKGMVVNSVNLAGPQAGRSTVDVSQLLTYGREDILVGGDDFYREMIRRSTRIAGLGDGSGITLDVVKDSIEQANIAFTRKEFRKNLNIQINTAWKNFYNKSLIDHTEGLLKPNIYSYKDFTGELSSNQLEYLQRSAADILGINLRTSTGRRLPASLVNSQLARSGIDPNNPAQLKAFLINNNRLGRPSIGDGFNFLGLKPVSFDEAQDRGFYGHLSPRQQEVLGHLNRKMGEADPISGTLGYLNVPGLYKNRSGQLIDTTKITNVAKSFGKFITSEFKTPIININPRSLFGLSQLDDMARKSPIEMVAGNSVQPFLGAQLPNPPQFFIFESKPSSFLRRSKGTVTAYSVGAAGERIKTTLPGYYRPFNNLSEGFLTRQARFASGLVNPDRATANQEGPLTFGQRVRRFFDVSEDQPNSIFRLAGRFARRKIDINNETIMAEMIEAMASGAANTPIDSGRLILRQTGGAGVGQIQFSVTDRAGRVIYDHETFIESARRFFEGTNRYGFSQKVMKELEGLDESPLPQLAIFGERRPGVAKKVSSLTTVEQAIEFVQELRRHDSNLSTISNNTKRSFSRIERILEKGNLLAQNISSESSPSIQNRLDALKSELYKYLAQRNADIRGNVNTEPIQEIASALLNLRAAGRISAKELVEAQGAALSALYNSMSFSNYSGRRTVNENLTSSLSSTFDAFRSNNVLKNLLKPFSSARNSELHTNVRAPFSLAVPSFTKYFGVSKYRTIDNINPLGANASSTFVPTFGSVFSRNPFGAIFSAIGLSGYSDPSSFSATSAISGHLVDRLNKNIGTFGMSLDPARYRGSFDLFARGLIAKRALPIVAGASTFMALDRTIGGFSQPKDINNERVYSPLVTGGIATGIMEAQSLAVGLIPGGKTYQEKREELTEGEIPIRQGRYWPLGNTPFVGGKIQYYRPSWYRKFQAGALFTSDTYGSPAEKALFYNDYSPLRPIDPYRFERKHYYDRPYPLTGEYFTGPFGQLVPMLNSTVGRIVKPQVRMHKEETEAGLANYVRTGTSGAFDVSGYLLTPKGMSSFTKTYPYLQNMSGTAPSQIPKFSFAAPGQVSSQAVPNLGSNYFGGQLNLGGSVQTGAIYPSIALTNESNIITNTVLSNQNREMAARAMNPLNTASNDVSARISNVNSFYTDAASYGPPKLTGAVSPRIVSAGAPIRQGGLEYQTSEIFYRTQEMAGIYGFTFSSIREKFGFGESDISPQRSVLQSAAKAYGSTRAFYDLNLGGMGDVPLPSEGPLGSLEVSEIVRRFIPRERSNVDYINPIRNRMGQQYPFLPGPDYFINFKTGDPFTKIPDGEIRLPGIGYERFNKIISDRTGRYGLANQFSILGDVAPYSPEFRSMNRMINYSVNTPEERKIVKETREQVENTTRRNNFSPYRFRYAKKDETGLSSTRYYAGRAAEYIAHRDTLFNTKFMQKRTAVEDYERDEIYGSSFSEWQRPVDSYIKPIMYKAAVRDPITATSVTTLAGSLFGVTPRAKFVGSAVGLAAGGTASLYGNVLEKTTGRRFVPSERKKQMALDEYVDILTYTKNMSLYSQALKSGDSQSANKFRQAAQRTMYGADIYGGSLENLSLAIPKRKREHFKAMIQAPEEERERILSTAPRLERRIYQAAWGMSVEQKPDLIDYFSKNELPDADWEGWHPNTNMEHVKVKIGQSMGIEMSQMGYYPQQIREANLANPSYPSFGVTTNEDTTTQKLRRLMLQMGLNGSVTPVATPFAGSSIDMSVGVR
jgi:hypothetical protein